MSFSFGPNCTCVFGSGSSNFPLLPFQLRECRASLRLIWRFRTINCCCKLYRKNNNIPQRLIFEFTAKLCLETKKNCLSKMQHRFGWFLKISFRAAILYIFLKEIKKIVTFFLISNNFCKTIWTIKLYVTGLPPLTFWVQIIYSIEGKSPSRYKLKCLISFKLIKEMFH